MMKYHPPRAIFGLNFLSTPPEDVKGDESFLQGAYDSEQQVWITQGQVHAVNTTTLNWALRSTNRSANGKQTLDYSYVLD